MSEPGWAAPISLWTVYKDDRVTTCEITTHPLGFEVRCYVDGKVRYSEAHRSETLARHDAHRKKWDLLGLGWRVERPPISG